MGEIYQTGDFEAGVGTVFFEFVKLLSCGSVGVALPRRFAGMLYFVMAWAGRLLAVCPYS